MSHFYFTLGPVQGFVSQARRTRDFWAGSFLLSWLTARAMKAVVDQGGKIVLPDASGDEMFSRVCADSGTGPAIGSLPNQFEAEVSDGFDGDAVKAAVLDAWQKLANRVWETDSLADAGADHDLWNDQIDNFWEIAWVLTDKPVEGALQMRKNWRDHFPPEQAGDKCTMMGEWQEISGATRPGEKRQKEIWHMVRKGKGLDLREGERLCAIAYVKRRFVHVWQEELDGQQGWKLPASVPSVSYMAAVHWLEKLIKSGPDSGAVEQLCASVRKAGALGERQTRITCVSEALNNSGLPKELADIDGRLLFDNELRGLAESRGKEGEISPKQAAEIRKARKALVDSVEAFPKDPTPFYTLLLMDGDNLGKTKQEMGGDAGKLSEALAAFTQAVPEIVIRHNGFLVYAGGDDVLAILPLEDALPCALEIRQTYMTVFKDKAKDASISAGIQFAHMKSPLTAILKDAHSLLDDVAKEQTGRDAIAVRVWKPGGEQYTWAMRWDDGDGAVAKLTGLVQSFQREEEGEPGHASKPLYRMRERLEMLKGASDFDEESVGKLLIAEYATSGVLSKEEKKKKIAEERVADLLPLCKKTGGGYGAEAAMLLRFLAQKGVER